MRRAPAMRGLFCVPASYERRDQRILNFTVTERPLERPYFGVALSAYDPLPSLRPTTPLNWNRFAPAMSLTVNEPFEPVQPWRPQLSTVNFVCEASESVYVTVVPPAVTTLGPRRAAWNEPGETRRWLIDGRVETDGPPKRAPKPLTTGLSEMR